VFFDSQILKEQGKLLEKQSFSGAPWRNKEVLRGPAPTNSRKDYSFPSKTSYENHIRGPSFATGRTNVHSTAHHGSTNEIESQSDLKIQTITEPIIDRKVPFHEASVNLSHVRQIKPNKTNFSIRVIVLEKLQDPLAAKDKDVLLHYLVADETGSVVLCLEEAALEEILQLHINRFKCQDSSITTAPLSHASQLIVPGDILLIFSVRTGWSQGRLMITTGRNGQIEKIGEVAMKFSEEPNVSSMFPSNRNDSGEGRYLL